MSQGTSSSMPTGDLPDMPRLDPLSSVRPVSHEADAEQLAASLKDQSRECLSRCLSRLVLPTFAAAMALAGVWALALRLANIALWNRAKGRLEVQGG